MYVRHLRAVAADVRTGTIRRNTLSLSSAQHRCGAVMVASTSSTTSSSSSSCRGPILYSTVMDYVFVFEGVWGHDGCCRDMCLKFYPYPLPLVGPTSPSLLPPPNQRSDAGHQTVLCRVLRRTHMLRACTLRKFDFVCVCVCGCTMCSC